MLITQTRKDHSLKMSLSVSLDLKVFKSIKISIPKIRPKNSTFSTKCGLEIVKWLLNNGLDWFRFHN